MKNKNMIAAAPGSGSPFEENTVPGSVSLTVSYDILFLSPARDRVQPHTASYGQGCISAYIYHHSGFTSRTYGGNPEECARIIKQEVKAGKTGVVGFYCMQDTVSVARNMTRDLKKMGVKVIVGGPQAAAMEEEEIRQFGADFVCVGEGEITVDRLLSYLLRGEGTLDMIRGIRYIDAEGVYHDNGLPEVVENLDEVGVFQEDWCLNTFQEHSLLVSTMTGRGCPFSCAFCHEGTSRKVRLRSVENVMAEIDVRLQKPIYLPVVFFQDDTFTMNPTRLRAFCREVKKRNLRWACESHVGTLTRHLELIDEMVEAGLRETQIGIESGSREVLCAYDKRTTPEAIVEIVRRFSRRGIKRLEGNLILGGALEDAETLEQSICLAERLIEEGHLKIELSGLYYAPFPLTPMTRFPENYGLTLWDRPYDYIVDSMKTCVNRTEGLTREQIQEGYALFRDRIYARYYRECARLTYTEISKYRKGLNNGEMPIGLWRHFLRQVPHVATFLHNGFRYHSPFNLDAVPIRSFDDLVYEGEALCVEEYRLNGKERTFLERANGTLSFREMAKVLGLSISELYRMYGELREKLLVYMEIY